MFDGLFGFSQVLLVFSPTRGPFCVKKTRDRVKSNKSLQICSVNELWCYARPDSQCDCRDCVVMCHGDVSQAPLAEKLLVRNSMISRQWFLYFTQLTWVPLILCLSFIGNFIYLLFSFAALPLARAYSWSQWNCTCLNIKSLRYGWCHETSPFSPPRLAGCVTWINCGIVSL